MRWLSFSVPYPPGLLTTSATPRRHTLAPRSLRYRTRLALANALRYFPAAMHETLAPEFMEELRIYGHIFMLRLRPTEYEMRASEQSALRRGVVARAPRHRATIV